MISPQNRGGCRILLCSIPQAWQLAAGKDDLFCHQRKRPNFGLADGALPGARRAEPRGDGPSVNPRA